MAKLKKPKIKKTSYWNYREVIEYVEQKYHIKVDDYIPKNGFAPKQLDARSSYDKKENNKPFLCFWHWISKYHEIHNGSHFTLWYDPEDEFTPDWVKEILKMIFDEFSPKYSEMEMYVAW